VRLASRSVAGSERSCQNELILRTSRATQSEPAELQDALQVDEPHLDFLALMPRPDGTDGLVGRCPYIGVDRK
jgi:hypothetical protein